MTMTTTAKPNALRERFKRALSKAAKREGLDKPLTYREVADRLGFRFTSYVHSVLRGDIDRGGGPSSAWRAKLVEWIEGVEK